MRGGSHETAHIMPVLHVPARIHRRPRGARRQRGPARGQGRGAVAHRRAPPHLPARGARPAGEAQPGLGPSQAAAVAQGMDAFGHDRGARPRRRCRRRDLLAVAGRVVRQCRGGACDHAGVERSCRRPGARPPLAHGLLRHDGAARRRRQPQGGRARARYASCRRHRPALQLRRQISRRCGIRAVLRRAQPAQGHRLRASRAVTVLRPRDARHPHQPARISLRHHAHHRQPALQRHVLALSRHPFHLLPWRRRDADAGGAHRSARQRIQGPQGENPGRHPGDAQAALHRHRRHNERGLDQRHDQRHLAVASALRHRFPVSHDCRRQ